MIHHNVAKLDEKAKKKKAKIVEKFEEVDEPTDKKSKSKVRWELFLVWPPITVLSSDELW